MLSNVKAVEKKVDEGRSWLDEGEVLSVDLLDELIRTADSHRGKLLHDAAVADPDGEEGLVAKTREGPEMASVEFWRVASKMSKRELKARERTARIEARERVHAEALAKERETAWKQIGAAQPKSRPTSVRGERSTKLTERPDLQVERTSRGSGSGRPSHASHEEDRIDDTPRKRGSVAEHERRRTADKGRSYRSRSPDPIARPTRRHGDPQRGQVYYDRDGRPVSGWH